MSVCMSQKMIAHCSKLHHCNHCPAQDALVAFWQNASGSQNISAELGTRENLKYIEEISCITLHSTKPV